MFVSVFINATSKIVLTLKVYHESDTYLPAHTLFPYSNLWQHIA